MRTWLRKIIVFNRKRGEKKRKNKKSEKEAEVVDWILK